MTTKLCLKSWSSPDVDLDDRVSLLATPEEVYFVLELEIGEPDDERADLFQVTIATPEGLRRKAAPDHGVLAARACLIVESFDWPIIKDNLTRIIERCEAATWNESVSRLQRYLRWEYEDYAADA